MLLSRLHYHKPFSEASQTYSILLTPIWGPVGVTYLPISASLNGNYLKVDKAWRDAFRSESHSKLLRSSGFLGCLNFTVWPFMIDYGTLQTGERRASLLYITSTKNFQAWMCTHGESRCFGMVPQDSSSLQFEQPKVFAKVFATTFSSSIVR